MGGMGVCLASVQPDNLPVAILLLGILCVLACLWYGVRVFVMTMKEMKDTELDNGVDLLAIEMALFILLYFAYQFSPAGGVASIILFFLELLMFAMVGTFIYFAIKYALWFFKNMDNKRW